MLNVPKISRRGFLGRSMYATASAGVLLSPASLPAKADSIDGVLEVDRFFGKEKRAFAASLESADVYLDEVMDAYAVGSTLRLSQSYSDQQKLLTAFVYDNALTIMAYLASDQPDAVRRARILGDTLLYAQSHDAMYTDGRVRDSYLSTSADANGVYLQPAVISTFTGNAAWVGMALSQLYVATRDRNYLEGALRLGRWIVKTSFDTRGPGGYTGGINGAGTRIQWKATEHNIDVYGFFSMLAEASGDSEWGDRAQHALSLIAAMFNMTAGFFWTGTGTDGATVNTDPIPEDVQTWSYMALLKKEYASSLDWVKTNLLTADTPQSLNSSLKGNVRVQGVTFSNDSLRALTPAEPTDPVPDPNSVWLEGTSHLAAALLARRLPARADIAGFTGDLDTALFHLNNVRSAQQTLGSGQTINGQPFRGRGIVAASSVLNDEEGDSYYPNLHIGATSWYLLAARFANPFQVAFRTPHFYW